MMNQIETVGFAVWGTIMVDVWLRGYLVTLVLHIWLPFHFIRGLKKNSFFIFNTGINMFIYEVTQWYAEVPLIPML